MRAGPGGACTAGTARRMRRAGGACMHAPQTHPPRHDIPVAIALLTTYLAGYRMPLYERLAARYGVEVLCYGRGGRYVPAWFSDLDAQLAAAPFPARRLNGPLEAAAVASRYEAVIAPFAGGAVLP